MTKETSDAALDQDAAMVVATMMDDVVPDEYDLDFSLDDSAPRFGGSWTAIKLEALRKYLSAYTTALKRKSFRLLYIDAFAGAGDYDAGEHDVRPGSARIALQTEPPFHELVLIELNSTRCSQLQRLADRQRLAEKRSDPAVRIIAGDANEHLLDLCRQTNWDSTRAVLFLDPFGMHVEWMTLERVAATRAIDVWYLFPLNPLCRQMARAMRAIDDGKEASITRIVGTDGWKRDLYEAPRTADLFGEQQGSEQRHADWRDVTSWVTRQLQTIFARVETPRILYSSGKPLYALYFAVSNPRKSAADLACKIARDILDSDLCKQAA
jgi:three-Cys-motif partner protein